MINKIILCAAISLIFMLVGCTESVIHPDKQSEAEKGMEQYVNILCSEEFAGRLVGTTGNEKTAEWLCEMLESLDIEPYQDGDYKMGFIHNSYDFQLAELTVRETNGTERSLVWGIDFYYSPTNSFDKVYGKDALIVYYPLDENGNIASLPSEVYQSNTDLVFRESHTFMGQSFSANRTPLIIRLTPDAYRYVLEVNLESIHIVNKTKTDYKEIHNVVGKIAGTDSNKAVVLTAHFDHMGADGATYFPGALDNASGVVTLLRVAELLNEASKAEPFAFDVVFAFCNAEEHGFNGSGSLVPIFMKEYKNLFNFNIDCIGLASDESYPLGNAECAQLVADMKESMAKHGVFFSDKDMLTGDDMPFSTRGIPAISLMTETLREAETYHTNIDTSEKLHYAQIEKFAQMAADFVMTYGGNTYKVNNSTNANVVEMQIMPNEIVLKCKELMDKVMHDEEAVFDDDLISYMPSGERSLYTYHEYLQLDERVAGFRDFGRVGFVITMNKGEAIGALYFLTGEPVIESLPSGIFIVPNPVQNLLNLYEVTPIEGKDGYFSLYSPEREQYYGFLVKKDSSAYLVSYGELFIPQTIVDLVLLNKRPPNLDDIKAQIEDFDADAFHAIWTKYTAE